MCVGNIKKNQNDDPNTTITRGAALHRSAQYPIFVDRRRFCSVAVTAFHRCMI